MLRTGDSEAGFSLLELLLVLSVLAFAAVAILPHMRGAHDRALLQTTATTLGATLRSMRSEALRSNAAQTLTLDALSQSYHTSADARPRPLPPGIAARLLPMGGAPSATGTAIIRFEPDGSATPAAILLTGGNRSALIEVNWQTGATRLRWGS